MYPGNYNVEWLKNKDVEPVEEPPKVSSVARAWQWRERGIDPPNQPPNKTVLENIAEDILVQKPLQITSCDLPGFPRSTFLMVFSPDGTKLASTHGNHNIYVSELASGKHVRILRGHPRTPWCIAFHPSHPQLIGSGCLGGQVRVWDIASGGSEVWNVCNETVIASIAFHPREQLLVIATYNELYFWDWSQPAPFTKVSTKNINEKVRYVAFDSLGFKLITGISLWAGSAQNANIPVVTTHGVTPSATNNSNNGDNNGAGTDNSSPGNGGPGNGGPGNGGPGNGGSMGDGPPRADEDNSARPPDAPRAAHDMIVNSYQTLVQRYDSLVRNYQRLFMVRHRLMYTPPLANTIDRGTDPMETAPPESGRHRRRSIRLRRQNRASAADPDSPIPGTSRQEDSPANDPAAPTPRPAHITMQNYSSPFESSPRSSLLGPLGFRVHSIPGFRSIGIASAFQPLGDERTTRLLPNPFSTTNSNPRQPNTSRTSGLCRTRSDSTRFTIDLCQEDHNQNPESGAVQSQNAESSAVNATNPPILERTPEQSLLAQSSPSYVPPPLPTEPPPANPPPPPEPAPAPASSTTGTSATRTSNSTLGPDPLDLRMEARTINESLDLIRDILRDSGTRLLNLITNMSMNILSNSERDEGARVPGNTFTGSIRRDLIRPESSSDSDSEDLEVNITRTRNASFREFRESAASNRNSPRTRSINNVSFREWDNAVLSMNSPRTRSNNQPRSTAEPQISDRMTFETEPPNERPSRRGINISDRMTFELDQTIENVSRVGGINISLSNDRFRVRTQDSGYMSNPEPSNPSPLPYARITTRNVNEPEPSPSSVRSRDPTPPPAPNTATARATDKPQSGLDRAMDEPQLGSARATDEPQPGPAWTMDKPKTGPPSTIDKPQPGPARAMDKPKAGPPRTTDKPQPGPSKTTDKLQPGSARATDKPQPDSAKATDKLQPGPARATAEPQPGPSSAPDEPDPSQPSTSRGHSRPRPDSSSHAYRRVRMGVIALQKHTIQLANMWLRGDRTSLRDLRTVWEDLRRRIIGLPTIYNRSLIESCMLLSEITVMNDLPTRPHGSSRRRARHGRNSGRQETTNSNTTDASTPDTGTPNTNAVGTSHSNVVDTSNSIAGTPNSVNAGTSDLNNPSTSTNAETGPSTWPETANDNRSSRSSRSQRIQRNKRLVRLQHAYRWRGQGEVRRRERTPPAPRVPQSRTRSRSNFMRTVEQNATRHVIRTRAMKILSVMFNMMMLCIDERGLSELIIMMLKALKKSLALTCFMMMSHRLPRRIDREMIHAETHRSVELADVVRIQNADHSEPINVDDNADDPQSLRDAVSNEQLDPVQEPLDPVVETAVSGESAVTSAATSSTQTDGNPPADPQSSPVMEAISQSWSHRVAVQIAAANRNTSSTARTRRDTYIETRRQKALHRTNPAVYPYVRRRVPAVSSHRIPAIRSLPPGQVFPRNSPRTTPTEAEAVAGPSNELPGNRDSDGPSTIGRDARENFIRLAHIRLRTAARNRFRRLQTIRLYTPSSVRDLFALQDLQGENRAEESSAAEEPDAAAAFATRRAHITAMLAHEGLLQVNDLPPPSAEAAAGQRLPRIHEYLQPIILAQNAMVVDDEDGAGGGPPPSAGALSSRRLSGMAGLLDAGIISEALPAPSHRVQAWDFTSGAAPDIADSTKNVVVKRCRIHNDASIDISKDGRLLVALLPVPRLRNTNNWLGEYHVGVYSLEWPRLGQCLHTAVLEQSAVSVALSPTARYLAVGLGSRRFTSSHSRTNIIALLYKLDPLESTSRTGLSPMKELEQYWEHGFTSLNCLRWAPQPGQGLVYANNTGQLIIMS